MLVTCIFKIKNFIAAMIISQFQVYMHYNNILLVGDDVMGALTLDDTDDSLQFEDIDALRLV